MEKTEVLYRELSYAVIGAAMEVHTVLGPGYLEAVYQKALGCEFDLRGISYQEQIPLPVEYKGKLVGEYFADFLIDSLVVLEIKAVSKLIPAHEAQAHHYLAATGMQLAILINFGESSLQYRRIVRTKNLRGDKIA